MNVTRIKIDQSMFSETEKDFLIKNHFHISFFKYSTGVCAIRIKNDKLNVILLPFHGQQIWRLSSRNRALTMKSIFDEPQDTNQFGLNYGGFLIHCGLTANGNPSENDDHPLHGELPNCKYKEAYISIGVDKGREYISISGCYTFRNSLEYYYCFEPEMILYENSAIVEMKIKATNYRAKPMKYMYMAHINWLPVDGSRLVHSASRKTIQVFNDTFGLPTGSQKAFADYIAKVENDPSITDSINASNQVYDPEFCMYANYLSDEYGYAHAMQVYPEGDASYVSFDTHELPNAVRWFARTGDEDAVAFAIPSTNNHLGYSRNDEKGLIREIPAKDTICLHFKFGVLTQQEAKQIEQNILKISKQNE